MIGEVNRLTQHTQPAVAGNMFNATQPIPLRARMVLPYIRRELPGWGLVMRAAGILDEPRWAHAGVRQLRGKLHGYLMSLRLSDWQERRTYFSGRFYDLELQQVIQALLRPGGTFVDIGANIGMVTLFAAHCVGPSGRVLAVEPNPDALGRLREHITMNGLSQVEVHPVGLSDAPGVLTLTVVTEHSGIGTFASVRDGDKEQITAQYHVNVLRGDDLITEPIQPPLVIKIDVEGFETRVIKGLSQTMEKHRPYLIMEMMEGHLRRAGSSALELAEVTQAHGYHGFTLELERHRLSHRLVIRPLSDPAKVPVLNTLWMPRDAIPEPLRPMMRPPTSSV